MADNYLKFSEIVPALSADERAWVRQVLGDPEEQIRRKPYQFKKTLADAGVRLKSIEIDYWPDFAWEINPANSNLWLYSEDHGDVGHVGELVRALLARFRPHDCWSLTWSESCSKLRIGEFSGGGLFVTAHSVSFIHAADWIQRRRRAFDRRQTRRTSP